MSCAIHTRVFRDAERPLHDAQIDIDQFARILHGIGVERGDAQFGHRRSDRPRIGITAADRLVEGFAGSIRTARPPAASSRSANIAAGSSKRWGVKPGAG